VRDESDMLLCSTDREYLEFLEKKSHLAKIHESGRGGAEESAEQPITPSPIVHASHYRGLYSIFDQPHTLDP
jgi:hypothetical protein